ncbi:hypothetical protein NDU88_007095 [Pleurodeles waltl]|uniref:Uncharacterized protein n=1 Tax=Pleurodeles waltl TaxID=8319 RepID=A0AAV7WF63_PLEWA|nr:hypothetical protein NDU88_007095 [Pleurodeles waltl]
MLYLPAGARHGTHPVSLCTTLSVGYNAIQGTAPHTSCSAHPRRSIVFGWYSQAAALMLEMDVSIQLVPIAILGSAWPPLHRRFSPKYVLPHGPIIPSLLQGPFRHFRLYSGVTVGTL